MKRAYVTCEELEHAWAGPVYHIGRSLEPCAEVSHAGPLAYKGFLADSELCARTVAMENVAEQPGAGPVSARGFRLRVGGADGHAALPAGGEEVRSGSLSGGLYSKMLLALSQVCAPNDDGWWNRFHPK